MFKLPLFFIIAVSIIPSVCEARPWPGTFSRQTYHTFYIEEKLVETMPFKIQGFNYEAGKPAILNIITAYTQLGLHPQNKVDPPRYIPSFTCRFKGNVPVYNSWTFILAVSSDDIQAC